MARKKQEISLQVEIETQEEWEEMLAKEGLTIVDIYQEWAGPCKGMISNFRKIKNEIGDDLLRFAVAKADTVDALERYRGKCQPCFLFYAGGVLVYVQRGAMVPEITRSITEHLSHEHKVLDGSAERKEVADPVFADDGFASNGMDEDEDEDDGEEELDIFESASRILGRPSLAKASVVSTAQGSKKGVTVAILKPNIVAAGKVDEIIAKMQEHGIEILEQTERTLTKEEAQEFYAHKKDEEFFDNLCEFMSSGPSVVLVLTKGTTGEGIIDEWRDMLGPANVEEAKESAPDSLRAQYGEESYVNAVHGSDSSELAMQELAFFFPNYAVPSVPQTSQHKHKVQRTLALIRPDALREKKDEILAKVQESGFTVAMQKEIQLTVPQAAEFYKEHEGQPYFDTLVERMTNGPVLALALAREDAVAGWRDLLGPKEVEEAKDAAPESLRAQFSVEDVPINQLHGSDSSETAQKELEYFFPMQQTLAVIKPDAYQTKDQIMDKIKEAGFHIAARKETSIDPDIAKQFYGDLSEKEYFPDLVDHMSSGPTLFMVLSREDAVEGWRGLIGPTDPSKAKEENPESLRAQFGTDVKANAVHGSSTVNEAQDNIKLVFGDMEFNPDGTLQGAEEEKEAPKSDEEPATQAEAQTTEAAPEAKPEETTEEAPKAEEAAQASGDEEAKPEAEEQAEQGEAPQTASPEEKAPEQSTEGEQTQEEVPTTQEGQEEKPEDSQVEASDEKAEEQQDKPATPTNQEESQAEASDQKAEEESQAEASDQKAEDDTTVAPESEQKQEDDQSPPKTQEQAEEATPAAEPAAEQAAEPAAEQAAEPAAEQTETPAEPAPGTPAPGTPAPAAEEQKTEETEAAPAEAAATPAEDAEKPKEEAPNE